MTRVSCDCAGAGFNLTLEEVEEILEDLVRAEGRPEVVQFSGGEPTIHPQIIEMLRAAKRHDIRHVMLNTNGKRIARDDRFLAELAELRPCVYFQFDGFEERTSGSCRRSSERSTVWPASPAPSSWHQLSRGTSTTTRSDGSSSSHSSTRPSVASTSSRPSTRAAISITTHCGA